ncbi:unnamed protein product [Amoebophrya sp. A25]|nr:unnamed protein product [Amoebophrya sp. A25]|eukprot:GSA25T00019096001.1
MPGFPQPLRHPSEDGGPAPPRPRYPQPVSQNYWRDKHAAIVDPKKGRFAVTSELGSLLQWWDGEEQKLRHHNERHSLERWIQGKDGASTGSSKATFLVARDTTATKAENVFDHPDEEMEIDEAEEDEKSVSLATSSSAAQQHVEQESGFTPTPSSSSASIDFDCSYTRNAEQRLLRDEQGSSSIVSSVSSSTRKKIVLRKRSSRFLLGEGSGSSRRQPGHERSKVSSSSQHSNSPASSVDSRFKITNYSASSRNNNTATGSSCSTRGRLLQTSTRNKKNKNSSIEEREAGEDINNTSILSSNGSSRLKHVPHLAELLPMGFEQMQVGGSSSSSSNQNLARRTFGASAGGVSTSMHHQSSNVSIEGDSPIVPMWQRAGAGGNQGGRGDLPDSGPESASRARMLMYPEGGEEEASEPAPKTPQNSSSFHRQLRKIQMKDKDQQLLPLADADLESLSSMTPADVARESKEDKRSRRFRKAFFRHDLSGLTSITPAEVQEQVDSVGGGGASSSGNASSDNGKCSILADEWWDYGGQPPGASKDSKNGASGAMVMSTAASKLLGKHGNYAARGSRVKKQDAKRARRRGGHGLDASDQPQFPEQSRSGDMKPAKTPFLFYPMTATAQERKGSEQIPPNLFRGGWKGPIEKTIDAGDEAVRSWDNDTLLERLGRKNEVLVHGIADLVAVLRPLNAAIPYLPGLVKKHYASIHPPDAWALQKLDVQHEKRDVQQQLEDEEIRNLQWEEQYKRSQMRGDLVGIERALARAINAFWRAQNSLIYLMEDRAVVLRQTSLTESRLRQISRDHRWLVHGLRDEVHGEKRMGAAVQRALDFSKLLEFRDRLAAKLQGLKDKSADLNLEFLDLEAATRLEIRHALTFLERSVSSAVVPRTQLTQQTEREVGLLIKKGQLVMMLMHMLEELLETRAEYLEREEAVTGNNGSLAVYEGVHAQGLTGGSFEEQLAESGGSLALGGTSHRRNFARNLSVKTGGGSLTSYLKGQNAGRLAFLADSENVRDAQTRQQLSLTEYHAKADPIGHVFSRPLPEDTRLIEEEIRLLSGVFDQDAGALMPWMTKAVRARVTDLEALARSRKNQESQQNEAIGQESLIPDQQTITKKMGEKIEKGMDQADLSQGLRAAVIAAAPYDEDEESSEDDNKGRSSSSSSSDSDSDDSDRSFWCWWRFRIRFRFRLWLVWWRFRR